MILKKLQLKNFKQYGKLELDFREGLVGIVGKNGSGKSSVFEAILLCLFGTISLDKNHYKSSWVELKESVFLELIFEVQGKNWRVIREFRGKALAPKAGLFNQNEDMVATDSKPVTQEIIRLLGMDKDAFTRSVFSGQKELGVISNTKGEERKRMVRKMVGLDKLDDIQLAKLTTEIKNINLLSAKTGFGVDSLKDKLLNFVNTGALRNNETIITNSRHYDALLKALEEIQKVQQGMDSNLSGDVLAIDIRQALYHFGEITGEITNDDLLGNIFANFCIGK
mgnify:CR=1 FL=1